MILYIYFPVFFFCVSEDEKRSGWGLKTKTKSRLQTKNSSAVGRSLLPQQPEVRPLQGEVNKSCGGFFRGVFFLTARRELVSLLSTPNIIHKKRASRKYTCSVFYEAEQVLKPSYRLRSPSAPPSSVQPRSLIRIIALFRETTSFILPLSCSREDSRFFLLFFWGGVFFISLFASGGRATYTHILLVC